MELEEEGGASLGVDRHGSSIRVESSPMALTTSTAAAAAAAGATTLPCASSPRRSKRKLEGGPSDHPPLALCRLRVFQTAYIYRPEQKQYKRAVRIYL